MSGTTPTAFSFTDVVDVELNTQFESNIITVLDIDPATPISIISGEYSIDGGAYTTADGTVDANQTVKVRVTSATDYSTAVDSLLTIGTFSETFSVTTRSKDILPDSIEFITKTEVELSTLVESDPVIITGIDSATPISIINGEYSIDGGTYTATAGNIDAGQTVKVRVTSASDYYAGSTAALTIGTTNYDFFVGTRSKLQSPDLGDLRFGFSEGPYSPLQVLTSSTITIVNIDNCELSVSNNCEYSIDGGAWNSTPTTINSGQTLAFKITLPDTYNTNVVSTLTVGLSSFTNNITTRAKNETPDAFTFIALTDVEPLSIIESNAVTITGIDPLCPISISGGVFIIDNNAPTSSGTIDAGQTVKIEYQTTDQYATLETVTLTIGTVSADFSTTTRAKDITPDSITFVAQTNVEPSTIAESNSVTIAGIDADTPISVTNGEYSIDGGAYIATAGTINAGQTVKVRITSADGYVSDATATLTIGTIISDFTVTTRAKDVTPNTIAFTDQIDVEPSITIESNLVMVTGIDATTPISIFNGEYSIDGGAYTATAGVINAGQTVKIRVLASDSYTTIRTGLLTIGTSTINFNVTTRAMIPDAVPDNFSFLTTTGAQFNTNYISNEITITGINTPSSVSITGGAYSIDGGAFTSDDGLINDGQKIKVRVLSKSDFGISETATLTIGTFSTTYSVTTILKDVDPNSFAFEDLLGCQFNTVYTSKNITVIGINSPSVISIAGGSYSIDNGPFVNTAGTINNNQKVKVRVTSGNAFAITTSATLTIDTKIEAFSVTTMVSDAIPKQFYFLPIDKASPNTNYISNEIVVFGINTPSPITIIGGYYSINNGLFVNTPGNAAPNSVIKVKLTTSELLNANNTATLTIGGVNANFTVKTASIDTAPNPFYFTDQLNVSLNSPIISNPVTISGINSPTPITILNGTYSINGGNYTSEPGVVSNGQIITLKILSSDTPSNETTATVDIGGFVDTFKVKTADVIPDQFYFEDIINAQLNTSYTSNSCIISGLTANTDISIEGGTYSINGGVFTNNPGIISNGQSVIVKLTSSELHNTTLTAVLKINNISASFNITTVLLDTVPNKFVFNDIHNVAIDSAILSVPVKILGITAPAPITITNGTYCINNGEFVNLPGDVIYGQSITLRLMSSDSPNTKTSCTVNIGGVSDVFSVTTANIIPDQFYFTDIEDVQLNSSVVSNSCTVVGLTSFSPISISNGEYSINGQPFTNASGVISNSQVVTIRVIASDEYETTKTATLTIGGVSATFNVKTTSLDVEPNPFFFVNAINVSANTPMLSNAITVSGITAPSPISIVGGTYSIADSEFVSEPGVVSNGQKVIVRLTSSAESFTTKTATLTIGNFSESFSITTNP